MKNNIPKIWYASYGSNLLLGRFSCYIAGGTPTGAQREYAGCTDTTLPKANKPITINAKLYFARKSKTWNGGGVAFITPTADPKTKILGRMYLITAEQFSEVVKQEIRLKEDLFIDIEELVEKGSIILDERSWYNKLLFLGYEEGYPILTFTNKDYLKEEINAPNEHYLKMVIEGLKETYGMSEIDVEEYLLGKW